MKTERGKVELSHANANDKTNAELATKINAELAQLVEQLIRPKIDKEGWVKVKGER